MARERGIVKEDSVRRCYLPVQHEGASPDEEPVVIRSLLGRKRILEAREQALRARERELLERLGEALERFQPDVSDSDLDRFREARGQLDGFFLLVVAGEFNSGKSTFINALLGERVLPEGVTPTTDRINVLQHGAAAGEDLREPYLLYRSHPAELLKEIHIVDTPGTNAVIRRHEELTRDFIPRCDLVLFVTSADRPFTESERVFLERIREWGKKIVFVINRIDVLANEAERREVSEYVRRNASGLLGEVPELFAVSSRQALDARTGSDDRSWQKSGFSAIDEYVHHTLDEEERIRLKLLNPLNVGLQLATKYKEIAFQRLKTLSDDLQAIESIDAELARFHERMLKDFAPRLSRLELMLQDMEQRGIAFFEETIRIGRIRSLLDSDIVKREFERQVIGDTPVKIETEVQEIIDWIVERNLAMWEDIYGFIDRRLATRAQDAMIADVGRRFDYNRQALLGSVGSVAGEVLREYDREAESRSIANEVQQTFATTALAEVGAVGLGALVATAFAGAVADVTGILLGTMIAFGGFYLIPHKRRAAQREFRRRMSDLRARLNSSLTHQVHREIERSTDRINEAVEPYRGFVRTQQERLHQARGELVTVDDALRILKAEVEAR